MNTGIRTGTDSNIYYPVTTAESLNAPDFDKKSSTETTRREISPPAIHVPLREIQIEFRALAANSEKIQFRICFGVFRPEEVFGNEQGFLEGQKA